ncbi:MAG: c-type cytochrome, partial [Burkholderiaceae bacterium]
VLLGAAATDWTLAADQLVFGFGRAPSADEIAGWDIDVRPDGHGVRRGKGTVAEGQVIYEAQCASCHGTFGENNRYMAIAGGVRKGDLQTGRAAALKASDGIRTLGTKLNHATTLWDYIYRAMPWTQPQSLSVDQVYAVTAYVLYLNEIVPSDFTLDEKNLLTLAMPNRNGLTTQHGLASVSGRPDVQGSACMKDCASAVVVASEMPAFARNQHGNLAEQKRDLGPTRGINTARYGAAPTTVAALSTTAAASTATNAATDLLARNACSACHGLSNAIVGPAFEQISTRYGKRADAEAYLVSKIQRGGQGVWGSVPMPPQPALTEADAKVLARWILGVTR